MFTEVIYIFNIIFKNTKQKTLIKNINTLVPDLTDHSIKNLFFFSPEEN